MMEYSNLVELAEEYAYLVASPMGYNPSGWYGGRGPGNEFNARRADPGPENLGELSELDVMAVLRIMQEDFNVDGRRTYLIGQSMGGGGTWYIGSKYPEIWAALAAMAPAVYRSPDELVAARHLPVMAIQGDADESVDVNVTRQWSPRWRSSAWSTSTSRSPVARTSAQAVTTSTRSSSSCHGTRSSSDGS